MHLTTSAALSPEHLRHLYDACGWTTYTADIDALCAAVAASNHVVTAWESNQLIGLARVVSDGVSIAYVQDILVHPDHQRKGIGES